MSQACGHLPSQGLSPGEACLHSVMHIPSHAEDLCYTLGILTLEMDAGIRCTAGQYCASC